METKLPPTCHNLIHQPTGVEVYLVGTAHYSLKSKEDIENVMRLIRPNAVVLELCPSRAHILLLEEDELKKQVSLTLKKAMQILKNSGLIKGIFDLMLFRSTVKTIKQLGVVPGIEFRTAYREALKLPQCEVVLGDRPLEITLQRSWNLLPASEKMELAKETFVTRKSTVFDLSYDDVETMKKPHVVEAMMSSLQKTYPHFYEVLLTERNIYLTHSLHSACHFVKNRLAPEGGKIIGVVGMAHVKGIIELFPHDQKTKIAKILQFNKNNNFVDLNRMITKPGDSDLFITDFKNYPNPNFMEIGKTSFIPPPKSIKTLPSPKVMKTCSKISALVLLSYLTYSVVTEPTFSRSIRMSSRQSDLL